MQRLRTIAIVVGAASLFLCAVLLALLLLEERRQTACAEARNEISAWMANAAREKGELPGEDATARVAKCSPAEHEIFDL